MPYCWKECRVIELAFFVRMQDCNLNKAISETQTCVNKGDLVNKGPADDFGAVRL
jgi:hypothetical protein